MEWWGLVLGAVIGFALAGVMAWRGRRALRRRQAAEIQDAATFGWMRVDRCDEGSGENGNENRS